MAPSPLPQMPNRPHALRLRCAIRAYASPPLSRPAGRSMPRQFRLTLVTQFRLTLKQVAVDPKNQAAFGTYRSVISQLTATLADQPRASCSNASRNSICFVCSDECVAISGIDCNTCRPTQRYSPVGRNESLRNGCHFAPCIAVLCSKLSHYTRMQAEVPYV